MATSPETLARFQAVVGEIESLMIKPLFGGFGIWIDGKIVGGLDDDILFLKASKGAMASTEGFEMAPSYPGAKPSIVVPEDRWLDQSWITKVLIDSAGSLPAPKPKKPKP